MSLWHCFSRRKGTQSVIISSDNDYSHVWPTVTSHIIIMPIGPYEMSFISIIISIISDIVDSVRWTVKTYGVINIIAIILLLTLADLPFPLMHVVTGELNQYYFTNKDPIWSEVMGGGGAHAGRLHELFWAYWHSQRWTKKTPHQCLLPVKI